MVNSNKSSRTERESSNVVAITSTHIGLDLHPATTCETLKDMKTEGQETINKDPLVIVGINNNHHQVGTTAEMREIDATRGVVQIPVVNPARMTMVAAIMMVAVEGESSVTMVVEVAITETTTEISAVIVTVGTTTEKSHLK
jgi:hypothetical protein